MKIKKVDFRSKSDKQCSKKGCSKLIKLNVVRRKPDRESFLCYGHWIDYEKLRRNKYR